MYLPSVKLIETLARAVFTVGLTFAFPLAEAGEFGLTITMIGLLAFALGWERHIDIQRRLVGADPAPFDAAVTAMMHLWLINYAWMLPLFAVAFAYWAGLPFVLLLPVIVVSLCEQQSNAAYNIAVVEPRYHRLLLWTLMKNLTMLAIAAAFILLFPDYLALDLILWLWMSVSLVATLPMALHWMRLRHSDRVAAASIAGLGFWAQHRASLPHFLIGLLAVLMLQFDRLVVGGIALPEQAGIYFRHVMLIAFAYQLFNIVSYNRRLAAIFALTRDFGVVPAQRVVMRELSLLAGALLLGFVLASALDWWTDRQFTERFHLSLILLAVLLSGAWLRMLADFQALLLHAMLRERRVLVNQIVAFAITMPLLLGLTTAFGIWGAGLAYAAGSFFYALFSVYAVWKTIFSIGDTN